MKTIKKLARHNVHNTIPYVGTKYGSQMGRENIGKQPHTIIYGRANRIYKCNQVKIYDKRVPMSQCGAYDVGGAYWGRGKQLRVRFTGDLDYVEFYRIH